MRISSNTVVSLDVSLSDIWGNLIQASEEPAQYLHGGYGDIFPAVESALEGKGVDERVEVRLEPEDAFGDYDDRLLHLEPCGKYPGLEVGMRIQGEGDDAETVYTVTEIAEGMAVLDANHPLAGMALLFSCKVVAVRPATPEEIASGGVDDPGSVIVRVVP